MTAALWYLAGLLTLPAAVVLWHWVRWAFSKTQGTGPCLLGGCWFQGLEQGEHYNLTVWLHHLPHNTSPRHRRRILEYWRERESRGQGVHPRLRGRLQRRRTRWGWWV